MGQQLMGGVTLHKRLLDHLRTAVVMLDHNLQAILQICTTNLEEIDQHDNIRIL